MKKSGPSLLLVIGAYLCLACSVPFLIFGTRRAERLRKMPFSPRLEEGRVYPQTFGRGIRRVVYLTKDELERVERDQSTANWFGLGFLLGAAGVIAGDRMGARNRESQATKAL